MSRQCRSSSCCRRFDAFARRPARGRPPYSDPGRRAGSDWLSPSIRTLPAMPCNGLSRRRVTLPRDTTLLGRHNLKTAEPSGEQAKLLASTGRPDKYHDVSEESVTKDLANAHNATQSACLARTARLFRSWSALWGLSTAGRSKSSTYRNVQLSKDSYFQIVLIVFE